MEVDFPIGGNSGGPTTPVVANNNIQLPTGTSIDATLRMLQDGAGVNTGISVSTTNVSISRALAYVSTAADMEFSIASSTGGAGIGILNDALYFQSYDTLANGIYFYSNSARTKALRYLANGDMYFQYDNNTYCKTSIAADGMTHFYIQSSDASGTGAHFKFSTTNTTAVIRSVTAKFYGYNGWEAMCVGGAYTNNTGITAFAGATFYIWGQNGSSILSFYNKWNIASEYYGSNGVGFYLNGQTFANSAFYINDSKDIGLSTITPTARLHIYRGGASYKIGLQAMAGYSTTASNKCFGVLSGGNWFDQTYTLYRSDAIGSFAQYAFYGTLSSIGGGWNCYGIVTEVSINAAGNDNRIASDFSVTAQGAYAITGKAIGSNITVTLTGLTTTGMSSYGISVIVTGVANATMYAGYFAATSGSTNYGIFSDAGKNYFREAVGIGNQAPNIYTLLDIVSSDKGVMLPRLTTAEKVAVNGGNPPESWLVYDKTLHQYSYWNGSAFINL